MPSAFFGCRPHYLGSLTQAVNPPIKYGAELTSLDGEDDHVHILFRAKPIVTSSPS